MILRTRVFANAVAISLVYIQGIIDQNPVQKLRRSVDLELLSGGPQVNSGNHRLRAIETYSCNIPGQHILLDVVIHADDVNPHERRDNDGHNRDGNNPEAGKLLVKLRR